MEPLDFSFTFAIDKVSIEMTGNKSDNFGNTKLMSFGFEKQNLSITKEAENIRFNIFGMTLGSYNKFEELYKFIMRTKNTLTGVQQ